MSDRGSAFTSQKFKEFLAQYGVRHILVTTATPHANRPIERTNRSLTPILAKLTKAQGRWNDVLAEAEFALNIPVNRSTGDTPARLLFGTNQAGRTNDELRVILERQNQKDRDLGEMRANAVTRMTQLPFEGVCAPENMC